MKPSVKPYALVAGGSKGIGYAIAEALAKRDFNLVLIGRHLSSLELAKKRLEEPYHIKVETLVYDLSLKAAASEMANGALEETFL